MDKISQSDAQLQNENKPSFEQWKKNKLDELIKMVYEHFPDNLNLKKSFRLLAENPTKQDILSKEIDEAHDYAEDTLTPQGWEPPPFIWRHPSMIEQLLTYHLGQYFKYTKYDIEKETRTICIYGTLLGDTPIDIVVRCTNIQINDTVSRITIGSATCGNHAIDLLLAQYVIGKHKLPDNIYLRRELDYIEYCLHKT